MRANTRPAARLHFQELEVARKSMVAGGPCAPWKSEHGSSVTADTWPQTLATKQNESSHTEDKLATKYKPCVKARVQQAWSSPLRCTTK